jgi:hypothetical protein
MAQVLISRPINTDGACEEVHRRVNRLRDANYDGDSATVRNALRAKDYQLMETLRQQAERIGKIVESQHGETRRTDARFSFRAEPTMAQLWREAAASAERGEIIHALSPYYFAAATWCGITTMPNGA